MTQVSSAAAPGAVRPGHGVGLALAVAGAIAFSAKAIIVKLAYRYGVDAATLIMLRMLFALPLFACMAWWGGRGREPLRPRDWAGVIGLGISGYYVSSYLDFLGLQYVSASFERLVLYLNPTLVLLLGWLLHRRPVLARHGAGMALSYGGVLLVFGHEVGALGWQVLPGALLVLGSAISYAVYLVYSGEMVRRLGSLRLVGLATGVACLFCIAQWFVLRPAGGATLLAPQVIWLSLLNATLCTAVPVLLVMMAIERVGAAVTAQTGMLGPLSTIAMSVWLLGEPLTAWVVAGTTLVIAGIYVFNRSGRQPGQRR